MKARLLFDPGRMDPTRAYLVHQGLLRAVQAEPAMPTWCGNCGRKWASCTCTPQDLEDQQDQATSAQASAPTS